MALNESPICFVVTLICFRPYLLSDFRMVYENLPYIFQLLCEVIQYVLTVTHDVIGSWFGAIVVLAILMRVITHPLYRRSLQLNADYLDKQKRIKPRILKAREEFSESWLEREEEIRKIHKEEGVSAFAPMYSAGILLIQIPILISVANVMSLYPGLKDQSFLWINDLSKPDELFSLGFSIPLLGSHLNLTPCIMLAVQLVAPVFFHNYTEDAPRRKKSLYSNGVMGLIFFVLLYNFPSGLVLYWTCANLFASIQMAMITKAMSKKS